jgi:DNA repair exonuclease SbcCD ATPase subunit
VTSFLRRSDTAAELQAELDAVRLRSQELETLKRELAERVAAVRQRERELERAGGRPVRPDPSEDGLRERLEQLERRERSVAAREKALADTPELPPAPDDDWLARRERSVDERQAELEQQAADLQAREQRVAEREQKVDAVLAEPERQERRLAEIEARLAELREAERIFIRTRAEVAARSEAVAARERLVAEREREVNGGDHGHDDVAISELEARLRRLERQQTDVEQTQSFAGGLGRLSREGARRPSQEQAR